MRDAMVQPATTAQIVAFANSRGLEPNEAQDLLEKLRARQIEQRRGDPYNFGYEPPIWYVAKALIRNPCWSDYERKMIRRMTDRLGSSSTWASMLSDRINKIDRIKSWGRPPDPRNHENPVNPVENSQHGLTAEQFAEAMRKRLGLQHPVTKLLIMGSNRSGKTDFSAKLCMQTVMQGGKKVCSGAQTLKTQKKNQMPRVWHYMPAELRERNVATKKATDATENISYTEKNGFAGSRITFANGSALDFVSYEQTTASQEGVEYDLAHLDEEYPIGHYDLYTTRVTSRAGVFLGTFTPLHGYTAAIAAFLDSAVVSMWHRAYLRPRDGGAREPWKELNLTEVEYEKLVAWRREGQKGDCGVPESRPENCFEWLLGAGDGRYSGPGADGREFDFTPRVAVCQGGDAAAIWFYGSDNPYGLPAELIASKMAGEGSEKRILASVYGVATELKGKVFKTSAIDAAIVPDEEIPPDLVRFMVCDPSPERNWCFGWFGYHIQTDTLYMYREWPGNYEVPGQGVPGPWVVQSDKNDGLNDGARGEGQVSFGWGYQQIFDEVERLEEGNGERLARRSLGEGGGMGNGERMEFRILDSRAAAQSKISKTTNRTLLEDLEDYCDGWIVADGQRVEVGYTRMNDKFTAGKLKIAKSCVNTITCLKMLTGHDGQKGACKDLVDLVRYAVMSDIWGWRDAPSGAKLKVEKLKSSINLSTSQPFNHSTPVEPSRRRKSRIWW